MASARHTVPPPTDSSGRRAFLLAAAAAGAGVVTGFRAAAGQAIGPGQTPGSKVGAPDSGDGRLNWPGAVQQRDIVTAAQNDEVVKGVERRLKCTCGCNLDVFTCRTTDFTCGVSPAMHGEVSALLESGKTPDQVVQAFVAKYGEQVLMAPTTEGFNLVGYLLPGLAVLASATLLVVVLLRRRTALPASAPTAGPFPAAALDPSPEDLERLRRELSQVES